MATGMRALPGREDAAADGRDGIRGGAAIGDDREEKPDGVEAQGARGIAFLFGGSTEIVGVGDGALCLTLCAAEAIGVILGGDRGNDVPIVK